MPTLETPTDYYALLGLDPHADSLAIRKAVVGEQRRWGARQNSPDLAHRQEAERNAQLLAEIREVLLDPARRALYDSQRVAALPATLDLPQLRPRSRTTRLAHSRWVWAATAGALMLAIVVGLATGGVTESLEQGSGPPVELPAVALGDTVATSTPAVALGDTVATSTPAVALRDTVLSSTPEVVPEGAADAAAPPQPLTPAAARSEATGAATPRAPAATRPVATRPVPRSLPDDVPVTLTGMPLATSLIPPPTQPFALAGGRYTLDWAVAGHQPCDFVITIGDPVPPALARTTLSNHILNRSDGKPALGQTSINLTSGKYRLEAYSDTCAWSLTLRAG